MSREGSHWAYTPTYSSWLNQVELWFSKIERDVCCRDSGSQKLVPELLCQILSKRFATRVAEGAFFRASVSLAERTAFRLFPHI
jgi:transposase